MVCLEQMEGDGVGVRLASGQRPIFQGSQSPGEDFAFYSEVNGSHKRRHVL